MRHLCFLLQTPGITTLRRNALDLQLQKFQFKAVLANVLGNVGNIVKLLGSNTKKQGGIKGTERKKGKGEMRRNKKKEENKKNRKEEGERKRREENKRRERE